MRKIILHFSIAFLLVSCAATPPKYSQSDLNQATSREQQIALYSALANEVSANPKSSLAASYQQLLAKLGSDLGQATDRQIRDSIEQARLLYGQAPISVLNAAEAEADPMRQWSPELYTPLIAELRQDRLSTESALLDENARLGELDDPADLVARVQALKNIRNWYGDNADADKAYNDAYNAAQNTLKSTGDQALQNADFASANHAYESLRTLNPDYPGIDKLVAASKTGMESSDFLQLLLIGDVNGAYTRFSELSARQLSPAEKHEFSRPAGTLAEYFAGNAETLVQTGQYAEAYDTINKERAIRAWMNQPSQLDRSTVDRFTKAMFDLSVASTARDYFGLEYGYLLLVQEFDPSYSTLEQRLKETEALVYTAAIRRVEPVTIASGNPSSQNMAALIAAGVREYLMANNPDDVKIVEREKLDDVMRERVMSEDSIRNSEVSDLESADFLIQGDLLTAEVVTVIKTIKNTERVKTGEQEVPNPAFEAFIKEKGKRKADSPEAPPKTIMQPIMEDISLSIEEHQKDGELGVTYRVIDSLTAEHLHSNSISKSSRTSDQAREGVRLGSYFQEPKLAELPPDAQILNSLASEVVVAMAEDLVKFLTNPSSDYFELCKNFEKDQKYLEAAQNCGNAAVLRKFKAEDTSEVVALLRSVTLHSGMRTD